MTAHHHTRSVDLQEVTLTLDEWPGSQGRPVLFLHATGFSRGVWRPIARDLGGECRPFALDLRGHGDSRTSLDVGNWTPMVNDVEQLVVREDWSGLVIVGHSLGAGVAVLLATRRPELVSALVLVEAPLRPDTGGRGPVEMVEVALRRRYEWPSRDEAASHLRARAPYDSWHPEVFAGFVETGLRKSSAQSGAVELACARETEAAVFQGSPPGAIWSSLANLDCPVWVGRATGSRGLHSTTHPDAVNQPRRAYESLVQGSGHFAPLERPEWVQSIVRDALVHLN